MIRLHHYLLLLFFCYVPFTAYNQTPLWHNAARTIRYQPDGEDFVIVNGTRRFNRAIYGTNTGFRAEAGDKPEFALYLPGMGGNLKVGISKGDTSIWITQAANIEARYRPGSVHYIIKDPLLGNGTIEITVLALATGEGVLIKTTFRNVMANNLKLCWAFGGATGKRFSRDGDIGADPESSFDLKPEYCRDNIYTLKDNTFSLRFGSGIALTEADLYEIKHGNEKSKTTETEKQKTLAGIFPAGTRIHLADANKQLTPGALFNSTPSVTPVIIAVTDVTEKEDYYALVQVPGIPEDIHYNKLSSLFEEAEQSRQKLAGRVKLVTPDAYLNTLGGALSIAADAIWEDPSYLHGAVAWRMRLNAWRGAYAADPLGWHDRAQKHFSSYALSQIVTPENGPLAPDTALHFARQQEKIGTTMFSSGYICRNPNGDIRAHHYDMNLVFIDQLLNHLQWTGNVDFLKAMWPVLERHLAWEKRNFDADGDGLYDAYCCIWASDALQYSGGGVAHSSAYNYRANKTVAELALLIGKDPAPYKKEADHILLAMRSQLWLPSLGWYAEYKDLLGNQLVHKTPGLWTIYHTIDSRVPDRFEAWQSLQYVNKHIPHIPMKITGFPTGDYFTLSTTNWQPYTWSINNVALAEVLHTSLAYWQGGRCDEAFHLWKGALVESLYCSASPGGFEQLPFYDAIRGELYRDFADPIGMTARTLVEGLFGITPNAWTDTLTIRPGFPQEWNNASLHIPDVTFDFKRNGNTDAYTIIPALEKKMNLKLQVPARTEAVQAVLVNGQFISWRPVGGAVGVPMIEISIAAMNQYTITIQWRGKRIETPSCSNTAVAKDDVITARYKAATIGRVYDPQHVLTNIFLKRSRLSAGIATDHGHKTFFLKTTQGQMTWWQPITFEAKDPVEVMVNTKDQNTLTFSLKNNSCKTAATGTVTVNNGLYTVNTTIKPGQTSSEITVPAEACFMGSNKITFTGNNHQVDTVVVNWDLKNPTSIKYHEIDLTKQYNDRVTNIFKNKYLSPRPSSPTLQLPWQGIGNWCYPLVDPVIDDTGLRTAAGAANKLVLPQGIPFIIPGTKDSNNIVFTSQWDNYPDSVTITTGGKGSHLYLLMAGSTNPMQSRMPNGAVIVRYHDNSETTLLLNNPDNWWPIEQDYYVDGFAFTAGPTPIRVHLKTGNMTRNFKDYTTLKGFSSYAIEGGAATILDLPLDAQKEIRSITVKAIANDVVIGLMGAAIISY